MYHWFILAQLVSQLAIIAYLLVALRHDAVRRRLGISAAVLVGAGLILRAGVGYLELRQMSHAMQWKALSPLASIYMRPHWKQRCDRFAAVCEAIAWWLLIAGIYRPWPPPCSSDINLAAPASRRARWDSERERGGLTPAATAPSDDGNG
jgi:hypothetical protein